MIIRPMKYTAHIAQTDEILECSNLQILYKAARRHVRYYKGRQGAPAITVRFYVNLPAFDFEGLPLSHCELVKEGRKLPSFCFFSNICSYKKYLDVFVFKYMFV